MPQERRVRARAGWFGAVILGVLLCWGAVVSGQNWPRFRGPNGQGVSETEGVPVRWSQGEHAWKISLPGKGHSSPVIWDGKVFVTCADAEAKRGVLLCVDARDGRELWRRQTDLSKYPANSLNSYASPTAALDADHLYLLWPSKDQTTLAALTHEGKAVWTTTLSGVHARHGKGSSPIVHGKYVIVSHEQEKKGEGVTSQWLAVDRMSGQIVWCVEEPPVENCSYSTPCVYRDKAGRAQVVFASNAHGITAIDPSTGDVLWKVPSVLGDRVVSSPVIAGDAIIGTCGAGGRGKRLTAVAPPDQNGASAREVYHLQGKVVPYVPTSVAWDGLLFTFHDNGLISCLDSKTGATIWSKKPAGRFYGSPICVNGILYGVTTSGEVVVLRAGREYELLGINPLGEKSHASPAAADGRLYVRTFSHLVCIGPGKP